MEYKSTSLFISSANTENIHRTLNFSQKIAYYRTAIFGTCDNNKYQHFWTKMNSLTATEQTHIIRKGRVYLAISVCVGRNRDI